jgi:pimeloyl-ACP methyl ester carboxylesterase
MLKSGLPVVLVLGILLLGALACSTPTTEPVSPPSSVSGMAPVNGGNLQYEILGEGPPLVLIHGGNMDLRMWDDQFELYARDFRVIRYDVRGYGRSSSKNVPHDGYEDLRALLRHLEIPSAHLVGLSLGGRIAVDFALEHPEMVDSLVLVGPGLSGWRFSREKGSFIFAILEAAQAGDGERAAELWLESPYMTPAMEIPELRARLRELALDNSRIWTEGWKERELAPPAVERLSEIGKPTLLIIGSRDVPDIQQIVGALAESIPGSRKVTIEGSGHLPNMERPEEFNEAVLDFLRQQ